LIQIACLGFYLGNGTDKIILMFCCH